MIGTNRDHNFGDYSDGYFGPFISMDFVHTVEITNVTFRDNIYPDTYPESVYQMPLLLFSQISKFVMDGCTFEYNSYKDGMVMLSGTMLSTSPDVMELQADTYEYILDDSVTLISKYKNLEHITITNCLFTRNRASINGSCISVYNSFFRQARIENCDFIENTSEDDIKGVIMVEFDAVPEVEFGDDQILVVTNQTTDSFAIINNYWTFTIKNCNISDNFQGTVAGMYLLNVPELIIEDCNFVENLNYTTNTSDISVLGRYKGETPILATVDGVEVTVTYEEAYMHYHTLPVTDSGEIRTYADITDPQ